MDHQEKKTVAQPMDERECKCEFSGICNECYYYSTWGNAGWCEKESHKIEKSNVEKDCYVR